VFRFRLQRVLDLRERKERDAATALVAAEELAAAARAEQERLEAARAALARQAAPTEAAETGELSVGALRTLQFLLGRLDERVEEAASAATSAEDVVAQRQDDLRAAYRDRRTLDRLRERAQESWRAGESAADRQRMDEIALTRFTQASTAHGGAGQQSTTDSDES